MISLRRGEIRWVRFGAPDKQRPVLLLTRDSVIDVLNEVIVAPVTRTVRGISTEVLLSERDGMPTTCAVNLDHVTLAQRSKIGPSITVLRDERWSEIDDALLVACGFSPRSAS